MINVGIIIIGFIVLIVIVVILAVASRKDIK